MAVTSATRETVAGTRIASRGFNLGRLAGGVSTYAILIAFLVIFLLPFIWIWSSAFKTSQEIGRDPFALPTELRWENLVEAWTVGHFSRVHAEQRHLLRGDRRRQRRLCLSRRVRSLHASPPRPGTVLVLFLLGLMVPFQSVMIPMYYLLRDIHMLETYWAFIVPGIAIRLPFGIFLMRGFFRGLPPELGDAARTDGANEWGVFRQVMLPLSWPGLATLIVFQFMWAWNEFAMPLIFVQRDELRPVSLGTMFFFGRFTADRGMIAAGVTLSMIPVVILYLLLQRRFIEGITAGALKS